MMGSGEPSLVVETTVAGLRVVSPEMHSFILLQSQFMCGLQGTTSAIPCSDARIFALLRTETSATHVRRPPNCMEFVRIAISPVVQ